MALVVLYKPDQVTGAALQFKGVTHPIRTQGYAGQPYGVAHSFSELLYSAVDPANKKIGGVDHGGISFQKDLDIDTPFFKEVCMRGLTIPKIDFFFFEVTDSGAAVEQFYFQITLKRVRVVESHVNMVNVKLDGQNGLSAPHLEDLRVLFQEIEWHSQLPSRRMTQYIIQPESKKG